MTAGMDWCLAPMYDCGMPFRKLASRRAHLAQENILRALTKRIDAVPGGINLGQGVCDLDMPAPLREGAMRSLRRREHRRESLLHFVWQPSARASSVTATTSD